MLETICLCQETHWELNCLCTSNKSIGMITWLALVHVTGFRSCEWLQIMWLALGHVTGFRSCDWLQIMWLAPGRVTDSRSCDWLQVVWLAPGRVTGSRSWTGSRSCDWLQVLWLAPSPVTGSSIRNWLQIMAHRHEVEMYKALSGYRVALYHSRFSVIWSIASFDLHAIISQV